MSDEPTRQLPDELRQEFVEAATAWLELKHCAEKRSFLDAKETHLLAERHGRVIDVLRRMLVMHGLVPAIRFRGIIFMLAPHPESLVSVEEASIRSIDG
jgi:hypothetical protein